MELATPASGCRSSRRDRMHVKKVFHVTIIDRIAKELGQNVDFLIDSYRLPI